jgi:two-component system response regulator AtoC
MARDMQLQTGLNMSLLTPNGRNKKNIEPVDHLPPDAVLFGKSEVMEEVRALATKVCRVDAPVLLTGDGGTGKEVLARWIHKHSSSASGQFVKVNCAAIPRTLLESELFGYEKGAFTGAHISKPGRVELANGGTLFLDEIADLDSGIQSKLLHFLQDGTFCPIGGTEEKSVQARLICATNKNLQKEIEAGNFRTDLFYRINVVRMGLPQLRERAEDIPALAAYFVQQYEAQFVKTAEPLTRSILQYLQNMEWPGNIRELSNVMARYVLVGAEGSMEWEPAGKARSNGGTATHAGAVPLKQISRDAVRDREKTFILEALMANQWNRRRTAEALKISYRSLIYKIREAGFATKRAKRQAAGLGD